MNWLPKSAETRHGHCYWRTRSKCGANCLFSLTHPPHTQLKDDDFSLNILFDITKFKTFSYDRNRSILLKKKLTSLFNLESLHSNIIYSHHYFQMYIKKTNNQEAETKSQSKKIPFLHRSSIHKGFCLIPQSNSWWNLFLSQLRCNHSPFLWTVNFWKDNSKYWGTKSNPESGFLTKPIPPS